MAPRQPCGSPFHSTTARGCLRTCSRQCCCDRRFRGQCYTEIARPSFLPKTCRKQGMALCPGTHRRMGRTDQSDVLENPCRADGDADRRRSTLRINSASVLLWARWLTYCAANGMCQPHAETPSLRTGMAEGLRAHRRVQTDAHDDLEDIGNTRRNHFE